MKDLLQISTSTIGTEQVNSVNAREIHEYLEVKTPFSMWIDRAIKRYLFQKEEDFTTHTFVNGKATQIDFIVTIDMAKELCMVDNSEKGRETRKYFISFEKQAKNLIQNQSHEIALMKQMINTLEITDQRVTKIESNMRIENWQQKKLEKVKNQKVYELVEKHGFENDAAMIKKLHSRTWKALKNRFSIPRYNELPACEFENGVSYIQRLSLGDII